MFCIASDDEDGCQLDGRRAGDRTRRVRMLCDRFRGAREREGTWMVLGILCAFYFCLSLVVYILQSRTRRVRNRIHVGLGGCYFCFLIGKVMRGQGLEKRFGGKVDNLARRSEDAARRARAAARRERGKARRRRARKRGRQSERKSAVARMARGDQAVMASLSAPTTTLATRGARGARSATAGAPARIASPAAHLLRRRLSSTHRSRSVFS